MTTDTPLGAGPASRRSAAGRRAALGAYAVAGYLLAMAALVYLAGFLADVGVPRGIDAAPSGPPGRAVAVDLLLLLAFAVQHSVMARRGFKRRLQAVVPAAAERSTYVLAAAVTLGSLMWWWQPVGPTWWRLDGPARAAVLVGYGAGWVLALAATFQVSHTALFGLRQAWAAARRRGYRPPELTRGRLHRHVRHPLMLGLLVVVWAAPTLTGGHLALAVVLSAHVGVGIALEERDLLAAHGAAYRDYRSTTPALLPGLRPGLAGRRRAAR